MSCQTHREPGEIPWIMFKIIHMNVRSNSCLDICKTSKVENLGPQKAHRACLENHTLGQRGPLPTGYTQRHDPSGRKEKAKLKSWLTKKPRPLGQSGTGSRKGTAWGKRWRHRSELQNSGSCRAPPADFCTIRDVYDVGIPMVLWSYCSTCSSNWWDGLKSRFPDTISQPCAVVVKAQDTIVTCQNHFKFGPRSTIRDPPPNRPEVQNEQCLERGGLKMLHVAQNLAQQNDKGRQQKVLSSVKQRAISHLSPHFKHVTNYPWVSSFCLIVISLIFLTHPDPGIPWKVSWSCNEAFRCHPSGKKRCRGTPLKSICCSNSCHEMAIDRSVFFFSWAEKIKIWILMFPPSKYYTR